MHYILRRKWVGNPTTLKIKSFSNKFSVYSTNDGTPPNPQGGFVFRWGTTSTIEGDHKTVNSAKAIHKVFDKRASRKVFSDLGMAPKSWIDYDDFIETGGEEAISEGGLVIVRPKNHIRGMDMHLCKSFPEVWKASKKFPDGYYISTYIKKVKEYRAFVVSGRMLGVCQKIPVDPAAVSWGCADEEGGAFKYVGWSSWNLDLVKLSLKGQEKMGIDFAAVDIIEDAAGKFYLLELNSAPSMPDYWAECFSKAFDYIILKGKEFIPVGSDGTWRSYIHPSLSTEAKLN